MTMIMSILSFEFVSQYLLICVHSFVECDALSQTGKIGF